MVKWALGYGDGALRQPVKNLSMQAIGAWGWLMKRLSWPTLVVVKYPTGESEEICLHRLEPSIWLNQQPYCITTTQVRLAFERC